MKYYSTQLALIAKCKCGSIVAAAMINGGQDINGDFTNTLAKIKNQGGSVEIQDCNKQELKVYRCACR